MTLEDRAAGGSAGRFHVGIPHATIYRDIRQAAGAPRGDLEFSGAEINNPFQEGVDEQRGITRGLRRSPLTRRRPAESGVAGKSNTLE